MKYHNRKIVDKRYPTVVATLRFDKIINREKRYNVLWIDGGRGSVSEHRIDSMIEDGKLKLVDTGIERLVRRYEEKV